MQAHQGDACKHIPSLSALACQPALRVLTPFCVSPGATEHVTLALESLAVRVTLVDWSVVVTLNSKETEPAEEQMEPLAGPVAWRVGLEHCRI